MLMRSTCVNLQLLEHGITQWAFGQHALNSLFQRAARKTILHLGKRCTGDTTWVSTVAMINLAFGLITGHHDFLGIDHNDVVAGIDVRRINGFVLTTQATRNFAGQAAQHHVRSVYHEPVALHFMRFGGKGFHLIQPCLVQKERGRLYGILVCNVKQNSALQPITMNWLFTNIVSALLLPPLNLLLLMILGMTLLKRYPVRGKVILWSGIVALWAASTPWLGLHLLQSLEHTPPLNSTPPRAQAIVVLGAGRYFHAPEYAGKDTLLYFTLERLRYANHLARRTNAPVLTSGGDPEQTGSSNEGMLMKASLEKDFQLPVKWVEGRSNNTADEAIECWDILQQDHVQKIYLVTHAWHMPRAVAAFSKAGFDVVPAPMGYTTPRPFTLLDLLPTAGGLSKTYIALHEWIGLLWYKLKGAS